MNNKALFKLSYGVYIVTSWDNGRPTGCTANSAMQITSSPATIAVSINRDNYTNSVIKECGRFAISILAEDSDASVIGRFGFTSGRDADKFDGVPYSIRATMPVPDTACAYITCKVVDSMETSTHTVFLGEIEDADVLRDGKEMTYSYYHNVVKGKTAKNAPTYVEETTTKGDVYKCKVCGYVYDGALPIPDDYVCPICGAPKSAFVLQ